MAQQRIIKCKKCGSERSTTRKNTVLCAFHSFSRDWFYANKEGRIRTCACGAIFTPVTSGQQFCHGLDCLDQTERHGIKVCAYCGDEKPMVHSEIQICFNCVEDPKNADRVAHDLTEKSKWLRKHPVVLEPTL